MSAPLIAEAMASRFSADFGICACAETAGDFFAYRNLHGSKRTLFKLLAIGVDGDKLNVSDLRLNHTVNGVVSAAAHSDDLDIDQRFIF